MDDKTSVPVETSAKVLQIEATGIEPIPVYNRTHKNAIENFTFWASINTVIPTFALGTLAVKIFYMGFWDAFATIFFFNLVSSLCVSLFATFGAKTGLRQMVFSRYSFGFYGTMLITLINVIVLLGWSTVTVVVGGEVVHGISDAIPVWSGILIIGVFTTALALFGYHIIHKVDKFAFIPVALTFIIVFAATVREWDTSAPALSTPVASILSFGGAVFGFGAGWTTMASDYTVFQPHDTSTSKIFLYTFLGNLIPLTIIETIGLGVASAGAAGKPNWTGANGGALIASVLFDTVGRGFGSFLLILLALSIVTNNVPNDYSMGLSMQLIGKKLSKINRAWWTLIGACIYMPLAIASVNNFDSILENFLLCVAYFLAPYIAIVGAEHFFFKKADFAQYNAENWESPKQLPLGAAAVFSFFMGVVGAVLGMAEVFYTGVVALAIAQPFGGDVGFEMAFVFALVSYLILRPLEKKRMGI